MGKARNIGQESPSYWFSISLKYKLRSKELGFADVIYFEVALSVLKGAFKKFFFPP